MITMPERMSQRESSKGEVLSRLLDTYGADLRIAEPGIIESFDAAKQTVTVSIALKERTVIDGNVTWEEIPTLVDVPVVLPRAGGYVVTMPITAGDECLVIFGDKCMDAWWQSGGKQNPMELRRHDLSDGYAILGCWSQPRVISGYSPDTIQIRNEAGDAYFEIAAGGVINIKASQINIESAGEVNVTGGSSITVDAESSVDISGGASVDISGGSSIDIAASGGTVIESRNFLTHQHKNVKSGTETSGEVL